VQLDVCEILRCAYYVHAYRRYRWCKALAEDDAAGSTDIFTVLVHYDIF